MKNEAYWRKKQIAAIGEAVLLVAKQRCEQPMAVVWDVVQYIDPTEDEGSEQHEQD